MREKGTADEFDRAIASPSPLSVDGVDGVESVEGQMGKVIGSEHNFYEPQGGHDVYVACKTLQQRLNRRDPLPYE